jgi:WD40 repeat protein
MDKSIRVWDLTANGACIQTLTAHENVVMSLLCWDQYLISCSLDNTIRVWGANPAVQLENTYTYPEVEAGAVRAAQTPHDVSTPASF